MRRSRRVTLYCPECNTRMTPEQATFRSYTGTKTCCKLTKVDKDIIYTHNIIDTVSLIVNGNGNGNARMDDRTRYILERLAPSSWVAAFLLVRSGHERSFSMGINDENKFYIVVQGDKEGVRKRITGRVVRLVRTVLPLKVFQYLNDADFEKFNNQFKAELANSDFVWRVVQGEHVREWYLYKTYAENCGSLNTSCMSYHRTQAYLDMYVKNPKQIKLITVQGKTDKKLHGRALLWKLDNGRKYVDRPYGSDIMYEAIRQWAVDNGMLYYNGPNTTDIQVTLDNTDFHSYPYLDTFSFFDPEEGVLSSIRMSYDDYVLEETDGTYGSSSDDEYYEYDDSY